MHSYQNNMKPKDFFSLHPVFTSQEYARFAMQEIKGARAQEALIAYHIKAGNLVRIRKGLFAVIPQSASAESYTIDPYLIASKLSADAVLGYHSALAFYGKSYSVTHQFCVLTQKRPTEFVFRQDSFRLVSFPKSLVDQSKILSNVKTVPYRNSEIKVTNFERTLVDMLDRPNLSGSWEEIWRSLESVEYFDIDKIIEYTLLLNKATTTSLVGFYLEQHRKELAMKDSHLKLLQAHKPKQAHYIDRRQKVTSKFNSTWNLMIPIEIIEQSWQEW